MSETYKAQAILPDGSAFSTTGTMQECAAWVDEMLLSADGGIQISITRIKEDAREKDRKEG